MKKHTIVVTHWVHQEVVDQLSPYGTLRLNQTRDSLSSDELKERMRDAHAMMAFMPDRVDEAFLELCPNLRVIGAALKGYDNFDVEACTRRGVWFTMVPDLLTAPTAELAVGLLLGLARNITRGDRLVRSGGYQGWRPVLYGSGLSGATIGILGMGRVGRAIAQRLAGFDASIIYHDPQPLKDPVSSLQGLSRATLSEVIRQSDYLICATPLNRTTMHLINEQTLAAMKPGSRLVNIGRGSVVRERAVAAALESGHLAGYAADVFEMEDWALEERPQSIDVGLLSDTERTLFTPHLGSAVDEVRKAIALEAARNIIQVLEGDVPQGAVNRILRTQRAHAEHA